MNDLFKDTPYSETIGSFIRNGNYPLEAHYIFPTEEALKEFYSDEVNITTIHKGLLKIVENDGTGNQGLYWVTKNQTSDELEFTKLISGTNIDSIFEQLGDFEIRLEEEIQNRKDADIAIQGTENLSYIPEDLNSLLDLANSIIALRRDLADKYRELTEADEEIRESLQTEVKALAGTDQFSVVPYLETLPYKNLTEISLALNKFLNEVDSTTDKINTLPELMSFLEGYTDKQNLLDILTNLKLGILGDPLPTDEFLTLRAIENFVRIFKADSEHTDRNLQSELDRTQIGVGLSGDGSFNADKETYYLQDATSVMNALKTLDGLIHDAATNVSRYEGNQLIIKEDGIYYQANIEYQDGIITFKVNGNIVKTIPLGLSTLVEDAYYEASSEEIVIVVKLLNGDKQTIRIPVSALIREWDVDNNGPTKVVELTREEVINGADRLSADVRLSSDPNNILQKDHNTLLVDGTPINNLTQSVSDEVNRAQLAEQQLQSQLDNIRTDVNTTIKIDVVSTETIELTNKVGSSNRNQLSAKARVAQVKDNILEQINEGLLVRGTSENITHNGETLKAILDRIEKPIQIYENMVSALQHETDEGSLFLVLNDDSLGKKGLHIIINENPTRIAFTSEVKQDISDLRDGIQLKLDEIDWYEG